MTCISSAWSPFLSDQVFSFIPSRLGRERFTVCAILCNWGIHSERDVNALDRKWELRTALSSNPKPYEAHNSSRALRAFRCRGTVSISLATAPAAYIEQFTITRSESCSCNSTAPQCTAHRVPPNLQSRTVNHPTELANGRKLPVSIFLTRCSCFCLFFGELGLLDPTAINLYYCYLTVAFALYLFSNLLDIFLPYRRFTLFATYYNTLTFSRDFHHTPPFKDIRDFLYYFLDNNKRRGLPERVWHCLGPLSSNSNESGFQKKKKRKHYFL